MAKRGAKPKPDHIKVVSGTDQPCRMNPEAPEFPSLEDEFQPPAWLTNRDALAEWDRTALMLKKSGVLTAADLSMLAALCQTYGEYVDMVTRRIQVPAAFLTQMRMLYAEFGMSPASRSTVKAKPDEASKNPFSRNGRR